MRVPPVGPRNLTHLPSPASGAKHLLHSSSTFLDPRMPSQPVLCVGYNIPRSLHECSCVFKACYRHAKHHSCYRYVKHHFCIYSFIVCYCCRKDAILSGGAFTTQRTPFSVSPSHTRMHASSLAHTNDSPCSSLQHTRHGPHWLSSSQFRRLKARLTSLSLHFACTLVGKKLRQDGGQMVKFFFFFQHKSSGLLEGTGAHVY